MKKLVISFIVTSSFLMFGCDEAKLVETDIRVKSKLLTTKIKIGKMTCQGCANGINKKISRIDGVKSIEVSYATSMAIVSFDASKVQTQNFSDIINVAGYETLWFE